MFSQILIFILILISTESFAQNDYDKYNQAYEFIKNDTILMKSGEKMYTINNNDIFVSCEIVRINRFDFIHDIVKYEYKLTDKREISLMADSLLEYEFKRSFSPYTLDTLNSLNKNFQNMKFVLFFSEIVDNQLSAEIVYNYFDFILPLYKEAIDNAQSEVTYYFYFDNDNCSIVKVFKKRADF